jgi:glutathione S-transferase
VFEIELHYWNTPHVAAWLQRVAARPATVRADERSNAAVR